MAESIVLARLELQQPVAVLPAMGSVFHAHHHLVKNLFLILKLIPSPSSHLSFKCSNSFTSFLHHGTQPIPGTGGEAAQHREEQNNPSPCPVAVLGFPLDMLGPLGCQGNCCIMFNLPPTRIRRSLSVGLLFSPLSPSWGCPIPGTEARTCSY